MPEAYRRLAITSASCRHPHRDKPHALFMAKDLTAEYQVRLRSLNQSPIVNDLFLLELALRLGSVNEDGKPHYPKQYRQPSTSVTDYQLKQMIDGVEEIIRHSRIAPGEAAGVVTAHSISEPITQSVMRTFHYAGVLTKPSALNRLNVDVSMSAPETVALAIALKPPYNKDYEEVRQLCHKLGRTKLSEYAHVTMDSFGFVEHLMEAETQEIEDEIANFTGQRYRKYSKEELASVRKRLEKFGITLDDDLSNEYTEEYQSLIDRKQALVKKHIAMAVDAASHNTCTVYLKKDSPITPGDLYRALNLQFKQGDGSYKTFGNDPENPLYYVYKRSSVDGIETVYEGKDTYAVQVNFDLPKGHFINFVDRVKEIELCNNCRFPVTHVKLSNVKKKQSKEVVEDESWDTSAPVDSYYEKVLESLKESGYKKNPPEPENDSTGIIEIDPSEFATVIFTQSDRFEHKRCGNCDHGWLHFDYKEENGSPIGNVLPGPLYAKDDNGNPKPLEPGEKYSPLNELEPSTNNFKTVDEKPTAIFHDRPVVQEDDRFIYPGTGGTPALDESGLGLSDYRIMHAEDGLMVAEPQENEYFILAFISEKARVGERKSGYIGQGGWLRAVKTTAAPGGALHGILDFDRTTCSDVRQVENVLGIEAARMVLFHNLITTIGDAGEAHLKHALLLTDAMASHNAIMTAPAGRGSVAGLNSQMGNRTEFTSNGDVENYGSVLAQAYERQVQVVLRRAVVGMIDDLKHVKSSAIAGDPGLARFGTLSGASEGKYSSPAMDVAMRAFADFTMGLEGAKQRLDDLLTGRANSELIEALKGLSNSILRQMDTLSLEKTSMTWQTKLAYTPELAVQDQREASILQREKWNQLMGDDEFMELFDQYAVVQELLVYILTFMKVA